MIRLTDADHIGAAIHDLRILHGLKQRELTQAAGIWQSMISSWESGDRRPDIGPLFKVFHALGYDLALVPQGAYSPPKSTETAEPASAVREDTNGAQALSEALKRFDIEAMPTADHTTEMWLGCRHCNWQASYGGAPTLAELVQRAGEHTEVCR